MADTHPQHPVSNMPHVLERPAFCEHPIALGMVWWRLEAIVEQIRNAVAQRPGKVEREGYPITRRCRVEMSPNLFYLYALAVRGVCPAGPLVLVEDDPVEDLVWLFGSRYSLLGVPCDVAGDLQGLDWRVTDPSSLLPVS